MEAKHALEISSGELKNLREEWVRISDLVVSTCLEVAELWRS